MRSISKFFLVILSIITLVFVWISIVWVVDSSLILPSPIEVFMRLYMNIQTTEFWLNVLATVIRSISAFLISVAISLILGITAGLHPAFEVFLRFPLTVIKSAPVVSFILLALFWFSSNLVPIFVSVLMTLPVITGSIITGINSTDQKLLAMAKVYGFTEKQKFNCIYKPVAKPYFYSGAFAAFGLSWKVVAAGEVLTLPRYAIGSLLQTAKVHLETADVFGYTITIIVLSYVLEGIFGLCTRNKRAKI